MGMQRPCLVEAARRAIDACGLPSATAPLSSTLAQVLATQPGGNGSFDDLRGQAIDNSISELQPHRMITLAPTIDGINPWMPWWPPTVRFRGTVRGGASAGMCWCSVAARPPLPRNWTCCPR